MTIYFSDQNKPDASWIQTDALAGYIFSCKQDKEDVPQSSELSGINVEKANAEPEGGDYEGFVTLAAVNVEEHARTHFEKSVKKALTIPAWLNAAAPERNVNFSQVLQNALKQQLHMD